MACALRWPIRSLGCMPRLRHVYLITVAHLQFASGAEQSRPTLIYVGVVTVALGVGVPPSPRLNARMEDGNQAERSAPCIRFSERPAFDRRWKLASFALNARASTGTTKSITPAILTGSWQRPQWCGADSRLEISVILSCAA